MLLALVRGGGIDCHTWRKVDAGGMSAGLDGIKTAEAQDPAAPATR